MKKTLTVLVLALATFGFQVSMAQAGFEIQGAMTIPLKATPADIAVSQDGKWTFVLTTDGKIQILNRGGKLAQTIESEGNYDRVEFVPGNRLILSSSKGKAIKVVFLDIIHTFDTTGSPFKGSESAPVAITVFNDFQCPYCARLAPLLDQVLAKYPTQVKVVFKNFPLQNHKYSIKAATAALAAGKQGRFWEFHDLLFKNYNRLDDGKITGFARNLNLDMKRFEKDRASMEITGIIKRDIREGRDAGVRGTPTIFINGKLLQVRSMDSFSRAIDLEVKKNSH